MNDEELTKAWLDAQGEVYAAHQNKRSTSHADTAAANRLNDAKKAEDEAWKALTAHRTKVIDGRA